MKDYADRADKVADLQAKVIADQSKEIQALRRQVEAWADRYENTTEARLGKALEAVHGVQS